LIVDRLTTTGSGKTNTFVASVRYGWVTNSALPMIKLLAPLCLSLLLFSCGEAPPEPAPEEITATTLPAADPTSPLKVEAGQIPEKDQVQVTTEANPQLIDLNKLPTPVIAADKPGKPLTLKAEPKVRVAKPATDGTNTPPPPRPDLKTAKTAVTIDASLFTSVSPTPPAVLMSGAKIPATAPENAPPPVVKADHTAWNALLQRYVNTAGNVNYSGFKSAEGQLDTYLASLTTTPPTKNWSREETMAYWINSYNAYTIKLILDNYPVKKITDLHGGEPWDVKWIKIDGKNYSLNNIEHNILRARYNDPRIHFAVNCAAASCPPIPNKAFTAENLNSLMTSRTRAFIRNDIYNTITADKVQVSKIFDWYSEDFGDLRAYLNKYATTAIPAGTTIDFREYDWTLNKQ
jgi:hypothetical protein